MSYTDDYQQYTENGKIIFCKVPPEIVYEVMKGKNALMIFYDNIELCRQKLGESPVVAKMLYSLYEYDKAEDKKSFKIPDFTTYEKGEMADVIFQVMLNAAQGNFEKYITEIMQKRYNGGKKKDINPSERWK